MLQQPCIKYRYMAIHFNDKKFSELLQNISKAKKSLVTVLTIRIMLIYFFLVNKGLNVIYIVLLTCSIV